MPDPNNPWGIRFMAIFHMANNSHLFRTASGEELLSLYEAKMIRQFDHRFATYEDFLSPPTGPMPARVPAPRPCILPVSPKPVVRWSGHAHGAHGPSRDASVWRCRQARCGKPDLQGGHCPPNHR